MSPGTIALTLDQQRAKLDLIVETAAAPSRIVDIYHQITAVNVHGHECAWMSRPRMLRPSSMSR